MLLQRDGHALTLERDGHALALHRAAQWPRQHDIFRPAGRIAATDGLADASREDMLRCGLVSKQTPIVFFSKNILDHLRVRNLHRDSENMTFVVLGRRRDCELEFADVLDDERIARGTS